MWLGTYSKRIVVAVDHLKVTQDLFDFPVLLWLDSAGSGTGAKDMTPFFNELSYANRKKIAVATPDLTQCYVEICPDETLWNAKKVELHFKAGFLSTSVDTLFGLYYDHLQPDNSAYVGDTTSAPAKAVWDAGFAFVSHMNDGSDNAHIYDSTSNVNHGTKTAANNPLQVDGLKGMAQSFNGTNSWISIPKIIISTYTEEAVFKRLGDSIGAYHQILKNLNGGGTNNLYVNRAGTGTISESRVSTVYLTRTATISASDFNYFGTIWDATNIYAHANGVIGSGLSAIGTLESGLTVLNIGGYGSYYTNGLIDEVRISSVARSDAWIKATNYTLRDTLVSWGLEEYLICPTGIASQEAFGVLSLIPGVVIIRPVGIGSGENFGTALIIPGAVTVYPVGITSDELLGLCLVYHLRKPPNRVLPSRLPVNRIKPSRM